MSTVPMTPQSVIDLFGDKTKKYAELISALYEMHRTFAHRQMIYSDPELKVKQMEHTEDYVLTIRGGVGFDTRTITSNKMQELKFDEKCRNISIDLDCNTVEYTLSDSSTKAAYAISVSARDARAPCVAMKYNDSRSSMTLARKLTNRRMQRVIDLYTNSETKIPEFDVFLDETENRTHVMMSINNVVQTSPKFIFELLRDPIANTCRIQLCAPIDDNATNELRMWFECPMETTQYEHTTKCSIPRRQRNMFNLLRRIHNPY